MIEMIKGEDKTIKLHFTEVIEPERTEQDLDVSAASEIKWVMASSKTTTTATFTKLKTTSGITNVTDGTDGWAQLSLTAAQTATLEAATYYWQAYVVIATKYYYTAVQQIRVSSKLAAL